MAHLTEERLAALLRGAEAAHAEYEQTLGRRDEDWPAWYARHIVGAIGEEQAGATAGGVSLSHDELHLLQAALRSYVDDFGHEEADVLRPAKALLARLGALG